MKKVDPTSLRSSFRPFEALYLVVLEIAHLATLWLKLHDLYYKGILISIWLKQIHRSIVSVDDSSGVFHISYACNRHGYIGV